jgi:peptidoglycan/LPS O-acetylase OafA/YrhL
MMEKEKSGLTEKENSTSPRDYLSIRGHVAALDGMRGLAISLVLFHHLWPWEWSTTVSKALSKVSAISWFGVDLFFVLSGFLITGILLDQRSRPKYFVNFLARRTLRIFPAYFLFLAICFLVLPAFMASQGWATDEIDHSRDDIWWYLLYGSNYLWSRTDPVVASLIGSSAAIAQTPDFLALTWSLAVEEQFYLVWPLLVFVFWRRLSKPIIVLVISAILIRLFLVLTVQEWSVASYMSLFARVDSLALGAALAYYARSSRFRPIVWDRVAFFGVFVCLPVSFLYQVKFLGPGDQFFTVLGYTITSLGFAGLLAMVVRKRKSLVKPLFESRPLTWLGRYSYAQGGAINPALFDPLFGHVLIDAPVRMALVILITIGIAWLSFHFYEAHFLRLKRYFTS